MSDLPDFSIASLGGESVPSLLDLSTETGDGVADFVPDDRRILYDPIGCGPESFEVAGPRASNHFRGDQVAVGIVTCGGLCPGMNNVVRSLVLQLWHGYGVRRIVGFRYGFLGLTPDCPAKPEFLTPEDVRNIHHIGGTKLGSSRGPQRAGVMVDTLQRLRIDILFCIGGDGTMRGTNAIYQEVSHRGADISVIGVPKTIDNDLVFIERTFGFDTAVSIASEAIRAAHVEAKGAPNGVGLVRLMGRHSGFIAASAAIASGIANLVLVPEQDFDIHGPKGVLAYIRWRIRTRGSCVVVVAEGAGQRHLDAMADTDSSGNRRLNNIGVYLRDEIRTHLKDESVAVKYIDPSYIIRAAPANAADAIFCGALAKDAGHAGMAGKTGMVVGLWLNHFTHVPLSAVTTGRKSIDLDGDFWRNVLESTGQPRIFKNP